ncbi:MAG: DMT family transporter [Bacteroidaceae bacterium]|nr:DMT family transporter [Bacteroidaceae bacterium]
MNVTIGHICMFLACAIWGLMAPLGKDAMTHGVGGLEMVTFRVVGGAVCFWIASLFVKQEKVRHKDMLLFFFAAMLSIVLNQCCYTIGLSITSPVNASIMTTMMPIITMILAALFLKEPITGKKVMGVFCGAVGAFLLITTGARVASGNGGVLLGDLLCLSAQLCFAIYLTVFKHLIQRYTVITCMKWMITYAAIVIMPISFSRMQQLQWADIPAKTWWETAFVVVGGTFLAYIFMMQGQKILRPTVVAMYNYVQPIIACIVSVAIGLGVFGLWQALAVVLVFFGVWLVTQSKSRRDLKKENHNNK